ncbi:YdeI/OmpD-associated family protein [Capnocytophaga canimorsus]|uniref:YdeI/OmpD-associated family protein n=1 Tax=Capnocytophaga canimorsus TaxID=28188 RepID=UPI0037D0E079
MKEMDEDLQQMTREQLISEVEKLRNAIRKHRDCSEHDLCWFHPHLWNLLPEKYEVDISVPQWDKFMQGCIQYRKSLDKQLPNAPRTTTDFDEAEKRHTQAIHSIDIENILKETPEAYAVFQKLSPSHKNEYIQWINEAKKQETKERRLEKMISMLLNKKENQ